MTIEDVFCKKDKNFRNFHSKETLTLKSFPPLSKNIFPLLIHIIKVINNVDILKQLIQFISKLYCRKIKTTTNYKYMFDRGKSTPIALRAQAPINK